MTSRQLRQTCCVTACFARTKPKRRKLRATRSSRASWKRYRSRDRDFPLSTAAKGSSEAHSREADGSASRDIAAGEADRAPYPGPSQLRFYRRIPLGVQGTGDGVL